MKRHILTLWLMVITCLIVLPLSAKPLKVSMQSYTFHKFTLMEAFEKTASLGIHYIEVYPGHKLGGEWGKQTFCINMDQTTRKKLMEKAASYGITIIATGVFVSDDIAEWQQLFQLAHDMKMEYITCEPPLTLWDEVEKLSRRYNVKVAVHNHPKPSDYWTPQNLLHKLEGRSKLLGACADVGHWKREGLDHMQCLKQMKGRIVSIHFKDIGAVREGKQWQDDTIWGKGILQVSDMVSLLQQQKFKGYLTIEYENNWYNSVPDIQQCLDYLSTILH